MPRITVPDDGGWTIASAVLHATANASSENRNSLLYGPPGTGKSTFACREGAPSWYRLLCHEDMSDVDVLGGPRLTAENGGTATGWNDGTAIRAWRTGSRLVIDEIDKAGGSALGALLAILDDPPVAAWTNPMTGETIRPAAGFHCIATMNGSPDDLPPALQDRFTVRIEIDRPHPDAIAALPVDLQNAARASAKAHGDRRVSIRGWRSFATLRHAMQDEEMAALATFGPRLAQDVIDALVIARDGSDPHALENRFS